MDSQSPPPKTRVPIFHHTKKCHLRRMDASEKATTVTCPSCSLVEVAPRHHQEGMVNQIKSNFLVDEFWMNGQTCEPMMSMRNEEDHDAYLLRVSVFSGSIPRLQYFLTRCRFSSLFLFTSWLFEMDDGTWKPTTSKGLRGNCVSVLQGNMYWYCVSPHVFFGKKPLLIIFRVGYLRNEAKKRKKGPKEFDWSKATFHHFATWMKPVGMESFDQLTTRLPKLTASKGTWKMMGWKRILSFWDGLCSGANC